jgi:hypothetical protein
MLLGRVYDWRDGTYGFTTNRGTGVRGDGLLDADTLEPVSMNEFNRRMDERFDSGSCPPWLDD